MGSGSLFNLRSSLKWRKHWFREIGLGSFFSRSVFSHPFTPTTCVITYVCVPCVQPLCWTPGQLPCWVLSATVQRKSLMNGSLVRRHFSGQIRWGRIRTILILYRLSVKKAWHWPWCLKLLSYIIFGGKRPSYINNLGVVSFLGLFLPFFPFIADNLTQSLFREKSTSFDAHQ